MNWLRLFLLWLAIFFGVFPLARGATIPDRMKDSRGALKWEYDAVDLLDTDPGPGKVKFNSALPFIENSTEMYIDDRTSGIMIVDSVLNRLNTGDLFYIQSEYDDNRAIMFRIMGPSVDSGGWWHVPIEAHAISTALIEDGDTLICQVFINDDEGGGIVDDTTAKYLSLDFTTGEWVTYSPTFDAVLPHSTAVVDLGRTTVQFRNLHARTAYLGDSVVTPILAGPERTWTYWFWRGELGTDKLLLGVDTINGWILACDGAGDCIPLTRDSIGGGSFSTDSVIKYIDKDGDALDRPFIRLFDGPDSVGVDTAEFDGDSPIFRLYSDSVLQIAARLITMVGDTTFGAGYVEIFGMLKQRWYNIAGDSIDWARWVDSLSDLPDTPWVPKLRADGRITWEPEAGGGGGSENTSAVNRGTTADSVFYQESGDQLQFRRLKDSTGVTITPSGDTALSFSVDTASLPLEKYLPLAGGTMDAGATINVNGGFLNQVNTLWGQTSTNQLDIGSNNGNTDGKLRIGAHDASGSDTVIFVNRAASNDFRVFTISLPRDSISAEGHRIHMVADPSAAQDAATKAYADTKLALAGGSMNSNADVTFSGGGDIYGVDSITGDLKMTGDIDMTVAAGATQTLSVDSLQAARIDADGALIDSVYLGVKNSDSLAASRYYVRRKADTLMMTIALNNPSLLSSNDTIPIRHLDTIAFPEGATILKTGYVSMGTAADTVIISYSTASTLASGTVVDSLFLTAAAGEDASPVNSAPTPEDYIFCHWVGSPGFTGTINIYIVYSRRSKA